VLGIGFPEHPPEARLGILWPDLAEPELLGRNGGRHPRHQDQQLREAETVEMGEHPGEALPGEPESVEHHERPKPRGTVYPEHQQPVDHLLLCKGSDRWRNHVWGDDLGTVYHRDVERPFGTVDRVYHRGTICKDQFPAHQRDPPVEGRGGHRHKQCNDHPREQKPHPAQPLFPIFAQYPFRAETGLPCDPRRKDHRHCGGQRERQVNVVEVAAPALPTFVWRHHDREHEHRQYWAPRLARPLRGGDAGREDLQRYNPQQHSPRRRGDRLRPVKGGGKDCPYCSRDRTDASRVPDQDWGGGARFKRGTETTVVDCKGVVQSPRLFVPRRSYKCTRCDQRAQDRDGLEPCLRKTDRSCGCPSFKHHYECRPDRCIEGWDDYRDREPPEADGEGGALLRPGQQADGGLDHGAIHKETGSAHRN